MHYPKIGKRSMMSKLLSALFKSAVLLYMGMISSPIIFVCIHLVYWALKHLSHYWTKYLWKWLCISVARAGRAYASWSSPVLCAQMIPMDVFTSRWYSVNLEKKHQGFHKHDAPEEPRMHAQPGDNCQVRSFDLYISKLHPLCDAFFQRPASYIKGHSGKWFVNAPLDKNTIAEMMEKISVKCVYQRCTAIIACVRLL